MELQGGPVAANVESDGNGNEDGTEEGHSGTLDPKVTGCLIVCIDRATRLVKARFGDSRGVRGAAWLWD